jgi:hypothetical protein
LKIRRESLLLFWRERVGLGGEFAGGLSGRRDVAL